MIRPLFRLLGRASAKILQPRTLAVIGGSSLALAVGVAVLPRLFPAAVFRPISGVVASPLAIVLFSVAAGLLGAQALRQTASDAADFEDEKRNRDASPDRWTPERAPEKAYYDEYRTTGSQIDSVFELNPGESSDLRARERTARKRIREIAVSVVAADENVSEEAAAERIADGSWTDDPRAAALVGGHHLAPLRTRIRDWASGERFERWATRALAEIEARERGETNTENSESNNLEGKKNKEVAR
ncbi:DUF7269 family protein [Halorussus ruber]|uniref:DUF7269 family protein n=1 Tax=Halorussus ruber TaxID=1126238 RepID=UPI001092337A|nr:hypothetical protein [Halorussus ruber]